MNSMPRPMATCRLQMNGTYRFEDARALVPYLARLGITHFYSSPILRSRAGSLHGYDAVDPATIDPDIGSETDFRELVSTLHAHGMGVVLDIVPNHMAASSENPYWQNVLMYGMASPYARWFDIDWRMPDRETWGRVVVPVLGDSRTKVIEQDQIALRWHEGRFQVYYFDHVFPTDPATLPELLRFGLNDLAQHLESDHPALAEMKQILKFLRKLPKRRGRTRKELPLAEVEGNLSHLAQLIESSPTIRDWAARTAETFTQGADGRARLRKFLDAQSYRLAFWRRAARILNYRRFFDINDLISLRQEDPEVFDSTHALVLRWVHEGIVNALRIDHLDGLREPFAYLERLAQSVVPPQDPKADHPIFIEKILAAGEKIPEAWPVAGTTGYEFANQAEALFHSPSGFAEIERFYRKLVKKRSTFEDVVIWGKRRVLKNELAAFVGRLADLLYRIAQHQPETAQLKLRELVEAIVEVVVSLPVYRTYIESKRPTIDDHDRKYIEQALDDARRRGEAPEPALDFLGQVLLLSLGSEMTDHLRSECTSFIERFQQLTGPAAAKGVEDTALYAYVPLVSLNEVGGEPKLPPDPIAQFHRENAERAEKWPRCMLTVTTHDTKRTADVRSRLDVLSEIPQEWSAAVKRWRDVNASLRRPIHDKATPDPSTEYLIYQTLVGIWPSHGMADENTLPQTILDELRERVGEYMTKAVREAKSRTSWVDPDADYEEAVQEFLRALLQHGESPFLDDLGRFVQRVARPGFWNAVSRALLHFTAPGTPDLYQGDELWNFALVDPDNRRPVDWELRSRLLDEIATAIEGPEDQRQQFLQQLANHPEDGRLKLHVIRTALHARRSAPDLFTASAYQPLVATGFRQDHMFAFARVHADQALVVAVPRLTTPLVSDPAAPPVGRDVWGNTTVPLPEPLHGRTWRSLLTGDMVPVEGTAAELPAAQLFGTLPVALLLS